jgi:hypothetical protein
VAVREDDVVEIDEVARNIYNLLQSERWSTVVAVWKDGSVSTHGLGFRGRLQPDGTYEHPLLTYVAGSDLSYHEVAARLTSALLQHGLIPASDVH